MRASNDTLFRKMALAGQAIAAQTAQVPDRVVALIQRHHPAVNRWALEYAHNEARAQDAQLILLGLVLAARDAAAPTRRRHRPVVAKATQALFEKTPKAAPRLLRPILRKHADNASLVQGILLGLVRCQKPGTGQALQGLAEFPDLSAANMAVIVRARWGLSLERHHLSDLRTLVRGGGSLRSSLRVQAAWLYLKRTGQLETALQRALTDSRQSNE
jgi:hypothetical protein